MPTVNPRVNVTLSPSLDQLVTRLAGLQRVSKSQVLRELLEAAEPALQRAVTLMAAAASASADVKRGLAQALQAGMSTIEDQLEHELATRDSYGPDLVVVAEGVRPGRRRTSQAEGAKATGALKLAETPVSLTGGLGRVTRGPGKASKPVRKGS